MLGFFAGMLANDSDDDGRGAAAGGAWGCLFS